jgi:hypothetical protein
MLRTRSIAALSLALCLLIPAPTIAAAAPRTDALAMTLTPSGEQFAVKVTAKSDGKPVEGAAVYLTSRYEPLAQSSGTKTGKPTERTAMGTTDKDGTLKVTLREPGHYFIVAEKQNYSQGFFAITIGPAVSEVCLTTDKQVYNQAETIPIHLMNGLVTSITLPNAAPWTITRPNGDRVFAPMATQALVEVKTGEVKTWTWDQEDADGDAAKPGVYVATLTTSSGPVTVRFCVSGLRTDSAKENPAPEMPEVRPFKDVTGDQPWGDPHVLKLYQKGIVRGKSAESFDPEGTLTRAEFVALLLRACGIEPKTEEGKDSFADVTPAHWAYACIYRAREMGIVTSDEYPDGFGPDVPITRMEICVMAARALGLEGEAGLRAGETLGFQDGEEVELRYRGYVMSAVEWGILKGYEDNTFRPGKNATRRESAVIIYRLMQVN